MDWLRRATFDSPPDTQSAERFAPQIELAGRSLPIIISRNARARRLTLRLESDGSSVRITLPRWAAKREAYAFAHAKRDWLTKQIANLPEAGLIEPGGALRYRGEQLPINWSSDHPRKPNHTGNAVQLGGPTEQIPSRLRRWLESEMLRLSTPDLARYCGAAGVAIPDLRLSRAKRRWGSCSSEGTVRINWRLVQAPDHVRQSVIAHEVAHLVHFDHSPAFHSLLATIFDDDLPRADRWLKQSGRTLYADFG